jgi:hypothetical protein
MKKLLSSLLLLVLPFASIGQGIPVRITPNSGLPVQITNKEILSFSLDNKGSRKAFSNGGVTGSGNVTYSTIVAAESPPVAVRLVFYNHTSAPITLGAASFSPTASVNDYVNPVDTAGNFLTPVAFKTNDFTNGIPLDTRGPSLGGTNTTLNIPAAQAYPGNNLAANIPGVGFTDWMPYTSLNRKDGGSLPLLIFRTWSASGVPLPNIGQSGGLDFNNVDQGRLFRTFIRAGSNTTLIPNQAGFVANSQAIPHVVVEFLYKNQGVNYLHIGDSLFQGATTTGSANNAGHQLSAELSTQARPITFQNWGVAGQNALSLWANVRKHIIESKPQIVVFPAYTPNDGHTKSSADNGVVLALMCAKFALSQGCVPIIVTPIPGGTSNSAEDSYRLSVRTAIINSGYYYADAESLGTGANPNRIKAEYDSGDGIHLNDAGQTALKNVIKIPFLQVLEKYYGWKY